MEIVSYITQLLEEHDCVIIPGFGGFIGNYSPARIDPGSHTFFPPSKKILFNINLKQNDGLLCNRISTETGLAFQDALSVVDEMVAEIRHSLKSGKSFIIPGVGQLIAGKEGTIQFDQDKSSNLLPDAFGLLSFVAPPLLRNSYTDRVEQVIIPTRKEPLQHRRALPRPLKWAAILALPVGIAAILGITQYDKLKSPRVNNAGILSSVFSRFSASSLVDKKEAPSRGPEPSIDYGGIPSAFEEHPAVSPQPVQGDVDMDLMLRETRDAADKISENKSASILISPEQVLKPTIKNNKQKLPEENFPEIAHEGEFRTNDHYAVIIGAFKIRENADKCIRSAKAGGLSAGIYDHSKHGLYRISLQTTNEMKEAQHLLSLAKSAGFSSAWLLAK